MASEKIGDAVSEREMYELKQAAVKYYTENGVTDRMEEILNSMFFQNPDDVYGHLSNYFGAHSKTPTISKVTGHQVLDSKGEPALQVSLCAKVKNFDKVLSTVTVSNKSTLLDQWRLDEKEAEDARRLDSVTAAVTMVTDDITGKLAGADPCDQAGVDEIAYAAIEDIRFEKEEELAREKAATETTPELTPLPSTENKKPAKSPKGKKSQAPVAITPDPPAEVAVPGCEVVSAVSMAVCQAAASVTDTPLYDHINSLRGEAAASVTDTPLYDHINSLRGEASESKLRLPLPVVTILQGGKSGQGKQNCVKEYMVTSCPEHTIEQGIQKIQAIQNAVFKNLFPKAGPTLRLVSDTGAISPVLDRPEQGLDLILEAATQLNLVPGTDFNIILNLAARDIFDYDKGRYEVVTGQLKSAEELVDFYADLVNRYPAVIALIDPIRAVERDAWFKLGEKISERCFLFGEEGQDRPGNLRLTLKFTEKFTTSGLVFKYDEMTTVTHLAECAQLLRDKDNRVMLSTSLGETSDTFLADLAVGLGAEFLRVGGLARGERVSKLNRLLQISAHLCSEDRLQTSPPHSFPLITPPEMTPTPEADQSETSPGDK